MPPIDVTIPLLFDHLERPLIRRIGFLSTLDTGSQLKSSSSRNSVESTDGVLIAVAQTENTNPTAEHDNYED